MAKNSRFRFQRLGLVLSVASVALVSLIALRTRAATQTTSFVLDLLYGTGQGQVGSTRAGERDPSEPPLCPAMFQVTRDGAVWVLDGINQRVLEFREGKQTLSVSTASFGEHAKTPSLFGVTKEAVFVVGGTKRGDKPSAILMRYDRGQASSSNIDLGLSDGRQFSPLRVFPLGADEDKLLITGRSWPDNKSVGLMLNGQGQTVRVTENSDDSLLMPGADGSIWRLRRAEPETPSALPLTVEKHDAAVAEWRVVGTSTIKKRSELAAQRSRVMLRTIGIDSQGATSMVVFEGRPLQPGFVRILEDLTTEAFTLEDLGLDAAPLTKYFASECYQVLPDGSILAQYATPERYRIVKISF